MISFSICYLFILTPLDSYFKVAMIGSKCSWWKIDQASGQSNQKYIESIWARTAAIISLSNINSHRKGNHTKSRKWTESKALVNSRPPWHFGNLYVSRYPGPNYCDLSKLQMFSLNSDSNFVKFSNSIWKTYISNDYENWLKQAVAEVVPSSSSDQQSQR